MKTTPVILKPATVGQPGSKIRIIHQDNPCEKPASPLAGRIEAATAPRVNRHILRFHVHQPHVMLTRPLLDI